MNTDDPNNLEGAPPTREELAENSRELDRIAPTLADKLELMSSFQKGQEPTEDDKMSDLTEAFWRDFRLAVAKAMRQCPVGREEELMVRLQDMSSVYGSFWENAPTPP